MLDEGQTSSRMKEELGDDPWFKKLKDDDWEKMGTFCKKNRLTASVFSDALPGFIKMLRFGLHLPLGEEGLSRFVKRRMQKVHGWAKSKGVIAIFGVLRKEKFLTQDEVDMWTFTGLGLRFINLLKKLGVPVSKKKVYKPRASIPSPEFEALSEALKELQETMELLND